jgi:histone acetyltransferase 1
MEAASGPEEEVIAADEDAYDNPSFSSAAQCIRFHFVSDERQQGGLERRRQLSSSSSFFAPVFTHQVFEGEWIRGYQPIAIHHQLLDDPTQRQQKPHRSFGNHILASHELRIDVGLAPDCSSCRVSIRINPLESEKEEDRASASRRRKARPKRHAAVMASKRLKRQNQDKGEDASEGEEASSASGNDAVADDEYEESVREKEEFQDEEPFYPSGSSDDNRDEYQDDAGSEDDSGRDKSIAETSESECDSEDDEESKSLEKDEGITRVTRMSPLEIRQALAKALPPMVSFEDPIDNGSSRKSKRPHRTCRLGIEKIGLNSMTSFLSDPIGAIVGEEFSIDRMEFVMSLASGSNPRAAKYHSSVQRLATWFIETADEVNVADNRSGGCWKILYLFRKHGPSQFSLAGYFTLYHFRSPFRRPHPGTVVRICQALVLPPYQRMGHGHRMLNCVYDLAHRDGTTDPQSPKRERTENIVEINVEDPAPAFTALRHRVDLDRFGHEAWFNAGCSISDCNFFAGLTDAEVNDASAQLKITPTQVHIVNELVKLRALNRSLAHGKSLPSGRDVSPDELEKRYRLMVKKRLNKLHREDLGGRTKPEAQRLLGELFDECLSQYQLLLRRAK